MPGAWTEVTVAVPSVFGEALASFLLDLGSPGLVTDDGQPTVTFTAYLAADARQQLAALRAFCADISAVARITTNNLPAQDWAHNWRDHFPPLAIGERLYLVPPWINDLPTGRIAIVIDPGLAFGTGHHATTQASLLLLERAVAAQPPHRALDLGTGSGILAIALAKLGVAEVCAVDSDSEACRCARENCARNGVSDKVKVVGALGETSGRFDLVVANLLSSLLIELAPALAAALAPGGQLIVSGILLPEVADVAGAFAAHGLAEHARIAMGEWVTLHLRPHLL